MENNFVGFGFLWLSMLFIFRIWLILERKKFIFIWKNFKEVWGEVMKRFFNGLTLSIIFGIVIIIIKEKPCMFTYIFLVWILFPNNFLSYILILVMIGIYLKNPISGVICGIVSLFSKYLTEITTLKFDGTPIVTFTDKLYPNLNFENLNIVLTPIYFFYSIFFTL